MNNDINLADIRAFVVIAKAGSFTAAAELLNCSRSHLSKQLSQLESALGVTLITRTTRSQYLTAQGKQFYQHCSHSFDGIAGAIEQTIDDISAISGQININCVGGYIGEDIIAPLINDFISHHPNVRVNLDFSSRRVDLIAREFDAVFRMGQLEDSNLIARKLCDIAISTVASPDYLQRHGNISHPRDLKHHQCITGSLSHWSFCDLNTPDNKFDVAVDGSFSCKNGRAMKNSALSGNGIARIPLLYCQQEIAQGKLVQVFKHWQVPQTPLYLVYVRDRYQPARLKSLIEFVNQNFSRYISNLRNIAK